MIAVTVSFELNSKNKSMGGCTFLAEENPLEMSD